MSPFVETRLLRESLWRAIILFGRNVATFKFALGGALLELAGPYATRLAAHLRQVDKQGTSAGSKFLDTCRAYNRGEINQTRLRPVAARLGFGIVINAFHVVNQGAVPIRFFADERASRKGIALTDDLLRLGESAQLGNLPLETEARWPGTPHPPPPRATTGAARRCTLHIAARSERAPPSHEQHSPSTSTSSAREHSRWYRRACTVIVCSPRGWAYRTRSLCRCRDARM